MALNPIVFTEKVVRSFLRYQLTSYPFADDRLHQQMRRLLSLEETRQSPLLKGPFISLSRPFRTGRAIADLIREGLLHSHMRQRIPQEITHVWGHQEDAIRAIRAGRTTLVSTGTGSGKTECFLYPIISRCLELKDQDVVAGISAVLVYPMNALAEDQLGRMRSLLAGTGILFGMYVGKTPEKESDVTGIRLAPGSSRADYEAKLAEVRREKRSETVHPPEELCSREIMQKAGQQPRILLTNAKQLELLLTRQRDVELFANARLDYLVFDEAHTFSGAQGAETACLIRRLRSFCGKGAQETVCIATSATIVDRENPDAARDFASRFFGVKKEDVATVGEAYEPLIWAQQRTLPPTLNANPDEVLASCVLAVDDSESDSGIRKVYRSLTGSDLDSGDVAIALHKALSQNELAYQIAGILGSPRPLVELPELLRDSTGRSTSEPEILSWLTLGSVARQDGRPLLRPVVHGFIRGISGAVVTFPVGQSGPRLWLAAQDEIQAGEVETRTAHFPITTCTTCGQHYFITFLKDFVFHASEPEGGQASGNESFWEPLEETHGGRRVVLTDQIVGGSDDDDEEESDRIVPLYFCRHCGAAHRKHLPRCLHCSTTDEMVELQAIRQKEENPGHLTSCISCGANGRRIGANYREPARPVRATNVADVHVLAQDMVHHSERPRLLVFCDNRQDAAFQAGWMKDHARRFRLRALMADGLRAGTKSIGDLAFYLDDILNRDESLSRALVPEVWQVVRKEGGGGRHEQERRKFLRFQVLREITQSARQPIGLEPWGRMRVEYEGLRADLGWIQQSSGPLHLTNDELMQGVASVLDYFRRRKVLHDPDREIFSKYWQDGDEELQQGYLPQMGNPIGTKLRRGADERNELVLQWLSERSDTTLKQIVRKWGVPSDSLEPVLESLFAFLTGERFLVPVRLKGSKGRPLPNLSGLFQVDADRIRLSAHQGVWRCRTCRRRTTRQTPLQKCTAWRCDGQLEFVEEDPDNYNLQLLDNSYSMLRPEEHTAMVPQDERERLENLFKGTSDAINCFVCTPTLEMGVDIGSLDAILMRNVPPLPANYWQRAGRAGRRHRMAVDFTYCRSVSHDRAYFSEPLKLLSGRVDPPAFNLRNPLMVSKHVHATVITRLHQYARDENRSKSERQQIDSILRSCLAQRVADYLFQDGNVRQDAFDLSPLQRLIDSNLDDLLAYVETVFTQGWPEEDRIVTSQEALREHIQDMSRQLGEVLVRLRRRLRWAMAQIKRLSELREKQGTLDPVEDALFRRCDRLIKRLKGMLKRTRREAEGYDDVNTYGVLAAEGFLPGYGLEIGAILGTAEIPFWRTGAMDFSLPRPPSVALREYVPGNLIYANGNKFTARHFHRDVDEQRIEIPVFEVSVARQGVKETNAGSDASQLGAEVLPAISVCDVELVHMSHISDEEDFRFQMGVSVYGVERDQHSGGIAWKWGNRSLHHRRGVHFRLVNVGASSAIERWNRLGYPICTVCGQSASPLSSDAQRDHFARDHEQRCGQPVRAVGFYADTVADSISIPACENSSVAFSTLEALRIAATRVLDMHRDDLQVLVIGHVDRDEVDGYLWDPMPGGSGLLDQICEHFEEIAAAASEIVNDCPAACGSSCIDCLQTFRNTYYHRYLERRVAMERLQEWGPRLEVGHDIPAKQPMQEGAEGSRPVNESERRLRHLLVAAGFGEGIRGEQLRLSLALGTTTPDVIYRAEHHDVDEGVCIYLDGLSGQLHGNAQTAQRDREIRSWLRGNGYEVIEVAVSDLSDRDSMTRHFRKLAGYLRQDALREKIRTESDWFDGDSLAEAVRRFALKIVQPRENERYVNCLPLIPLRAAAGAFGAPQSVTDTGWDWVEVHRPKLHRGMFVAQVVGHSMEPMIPDGSYCIFSAPVQGSRSYARAVLVQLRDTKDPETGERYTVKKYQSQKAQNEEGWRHLKITLKPTNPAYEPIELTCDSEDQLQVIAEFLDVLN